MRDLHRISSVNDLRIVTAKQRAALDLTFIALYTELALDARTLPRWEKGQHELRLGTMIPLLKLLGLGLYVGEVPEDQRPRAPGGGQ